MQHTARSSSEAEQIFNNSFNHRPTHSFQGKHRMNTNSNAAQNINNDTLSDIDRAATAARLQAEIDERQEQLNKLRSENDANATGASNVASELRKGNKLRTFRRVLGWTAGVGVVAVGAAYVIGRVRAAGVEVPVGEAIDAAIDAVGN
ncbi:hypothetical protein LUCX_120 [Xanthomonas phage vB_XciM_LucasX]|nr:hypothetical protein LUCX_120 [Xanthomonas phage vB_XciM_LucasX]